MFNINVNEQEAQLIINALAELKLKDGLGTFTNVRSQLEKQIADKTEKKLEE